MIALCLVVGVGLQAVGLIILSIMARQSHTLVFESQHLTFDVDS